MADSGYKGISRIDQPKKQHHGWFVRVTWKRETHRKFFSDTKYGGREEALREAVEYRNFLEAELGKPRSERQVIGTSRGTNTGRRGIRRISSTQRKRGREYTREVYEVTYHPSPGITKRTSVSIRKYGEEEAFQRACAIRQAAEEEFFQSIQDAKNIPLPHGIKKRYLKGQPVCRVAFRVPEDQIPGDVHTLHIVGDFTRWQQDAKPMRKRNGVYTIRFDLQAGRSYEYLYLVNRQEWMEDPFAETSVDNEFGGKNSMVVV